MVVTNILSTSLQVTLTLDCAWSLEVEKVEGSCHRRSPWHVSRLSLTWGKKVPTAFLLHWERRRVRIKSWIISVYHFKKNAQEFGKGEQRTGAQNRNGWRPAYVLAAFFRVLFRSRFVFSLEQRPGGERIPFFVLCHSCPPCPLCHSPLCLLAHSFEVE